MSDFLKTAAMILGGAAVLGAAGWAAVELDKQFYEALERCEQKKRFKAACADTRVAVQHADNNDEHLTYAYASVAISKFKLADMDADARTVVRRLEQIQKRYEGKRKEPKTSEPAMTLKHGEPAAFSPAGEAARAKAILATGSYVARRVLAEIERGDARAAGEEARRLLNKEERAAAKIVIADYYERAA